MNNDRRILARLDDLIEIAQGTCANGVTQGAVDPAGLSPNDQISSYQIGGRQVIMTGDSDKRAMKAPRHIFHEAGFATAGWPLKQHRQLIAPGSFKNRDFIPLRGIVGLCLDDFCNGLDSVHAICSGGSGAGIKETVP